MPSLPVSILAVRSRSDTVDQLQALCERASAIGVGGLLWQPAGSPWDLDEAIAGGFLAACRAAGLGALIEIDPSRIPADHALVAAHPEFFTIRRDGRTNAVVDPRKPFALSGEAVARLGSAETRALLVAPLAERFIALSRLGFQGFVLPKGGRGAAGFLAALLARVRNSVPESWFLGRVPSERGLDFGDQAAFDCLVARLDGVIAPEPASNDLYEAVRTMAPLIVEVGGHASKPASLLMAAATGNGIIIPAELLRHADSLAAIARAIGLGKHTAELHGELRSLSSPLAEVRAMLRTDVPDVRHAAEAFLILINTSAVAVPEPETKQYAASMGADFERFERVDDADPAGSALEPGGARLLVAKRARPILGGGTPAPDDARAAAAADRLVLEDIRPRVDGGEFAVKRIVGEAVTVQATLFGDGHEQLGAELLWRARDEAEWRRAPMEQLPNDEWRGQLQLERLGAYEFAVEGWLDRFGGFQRDFAKKLAAEVDQPVDQAEGRALIDAAVGRVQGALANELKAVCERLDGADGGQRGAALLLSPELSRLMAQADDRPHRLRSAPQRVDAERLAARYSSWYELFPRSQTDERSRHGTFADVIARLPAVRAMGFDTLYFPPIHPIGRSNRKGPNNSLTPGPDDPGSPYAIGGAEGGHDTIHPELGTFDDFRRLIAAARDHGLEIALDFAVQCSPDHPWLEQHPGWFAWRPDGSMKYAENPPKKYQDIVNVDFYGPDAVPDLWLALRDIVLLWARAGVKTFRVDNPHTKPLPFWEWMIGEVRAQHPELIFLAEAFTRPTMMYRLGKIGFSQSYTYFTWRDHKQELTDYIVELTTTAPKEFYRPHFFVNTPDINPYFLQTSGRSGFRIRAVLAATLSGLFGVYSGFELCEAAPVAGKEEYLDSEKYELRPRDWQAPGNIIADITLLNRLRRANPALQTHLNTRFYAAHNDQIIWYGKPAPAGSEMIMVMVSLDPHGPQEADFEVPLWEFGLPDDASIEVEDLAEGWRFQWHGKAQHIRLDPDQPYRIWRLAPGAGA